MKDNAEELCKALEEVLLFAHAWRNHCKPTSDEEADQIRMALIERAEDKVRQYRGWANTKVSDG